MEKGLKEIICEEVWHNPSNLFGCKFLESGGYLTSEPYEGKPRGAIRLGRTSNNVTVLCNSGSGSAGTQCSIFDYVVEVQGKAGTFTEAMRHLAGLYGIEYKQTEEELKKLTLQGIAKEAADTLRTSLAMNKGGEVAAYLAGRGFGPETFSHFGELTSESIAKVKKDLTTKGVKFSNTDLAALGITEQRANEGYSLVIPYVVNGTVTGFLFRCIRKLAPGQNKYYFSSGLSRGGFCERLPFGREQTAVVVEGEMDALRLIVSGVQNVVAMGNDKINDNTADMLLTRGFSSVCYIPDLEYDTDKRKNVKRPHDALEAFHKKGFTHLAISELPEPKDLNGYENYDKNGNLNGYKTDADRYGRENGPEDVRELVGLNVCSWYDWEIGELRKWAEGAEMDYQKVVALQDRVDSIYARCSAHERELLKKHIARVEVMKNNGITPRSLDDLDAKDRSKRFADKVAALHNDLGKAIAEGSNPVKVAKVLEAVNDLNGIEERSCWDKQMAQSFEDELEEIKNQPDPIRSKWRLAWVNSKANSLNGEKSIIDGDWVQFFPYDVTFFCASTSHGKTAILMQAAMDMVTTYKEKSVLYISAEEQKSQLRIRSLNNYINIHNTSSGLHNNAPCIISGTRRESILAAIKGKQPDAYQSKELPGAPYWSEIAKGINKEIAKYKEEIWPRLKLIHTDATVESIVSNAIYHVEEMRDNGVEVSGVFIDYIQLLSTEERKQNRTDELKTICIALHKLAGRLGVPIVLAAQFNRKAVIEGIDNITIANVAEASDIEKIAHDIYMVWSTEKTKKDLYYRQSKAKENEGKDVKVWEFGERSRRIFWTVDTNGNETSKELKNRDGHGFLYIENLKARDGRTGCWGLLPFDGEWGRVEENDTDAMKKN